MIQSGKYLHILTFNLCLLFHPYLLEARFHEVAELFQIVLITIGLTLDGVVFSIMELCVLPRVGIVVQFTDADLAFNLLQAHAPVVEYILVEEHGILLLDLSVFYLVALSFEEFNSAQITGLVCLHLIRS